MTDLRPIDLFVVPVWNFRATPTPEQIAARAESITATGMHPIIKAAATANADGKHELMDSFLNLEAMKLLGVQMVKVEWIDVPVEDRPWAAIQFCHRRNISHFELAMILPHLDDHYTRHLFRKSPEPLRRSKFISKQFIALGFSHLVLNQNNVDRFKFICNHPDREMLLRRLDSKRRQLQSTYELAVKLMPSSEGEDGADNRADNNSTDGNNSNEANTNGNERTDSRTCEPVASGRLVPIKIEVNGKIWKCRAGDLCGHCKVHEFVMRATTTLPQIDGSPADQAPSTQTNANDIVYTPRNIAKEIIDTFAPTGTILDPSKGLGAFYDQYPDHCEKDWCEITEGRDFFDFTRPVDWIITNPPYSIFNEFMKHSFEIADNVVFLIPQNKQYSSHIRLRMIREYGGEMKRIQFTADARHFGFPFGFPLAACHWQRGYDGPLTIINSDSKGELI